MIEVKLRFFTNKIADEKGKIIPKHAWTSGVVRMERNGARDITPGLPLLFHSLLDVGAVIEKTLVNHGIKLHPSPRTKKYLIP